MQITQVTPRFPPAIGGVEEHVYRVSLELARRGHKITVITSNEVDHLTRSKETETIDGVVIHRFPLLMPRTFREYWLIPGVLESLPYLKADVVHVHGYRCLGSYIAVRLAHFEDTPVVFTPHGIYPPRSRANTFLKTVFDSTLGRLMLNLSDKIIALTEHNKQLLLRIGAPKEKISIVPNGVNLEEFVGIKQKAKQKMLKEIKADGPTLLYVGRIDWNKRIDKIVEAMPLILKEFPSAKLIIAGPDYANYTNKLKRLGEKLKVKHALTITGSVPRETLLAFYSTADAFLMPSSYEGFGLSLLEAMSSKIPVIASSSGGPGDILTHGVNALLLKEASATEISEAVKLVLLNKKLQETIVQNAFALVEKKYTWKDVVDELELIYKEVIETKNAKTSEDFPFYVTCP
ncbi:MAG: glycosyltransferase family 4 protein [Candidatus Bathycorpusculaceae bacterium]